MNETDKQDKKDNWRALAEQMGVEVPPEAQSRSEALSTPAANTPRPPARKKPSQAPPPRPPADWAGLASQLGIETPEVEADQGPDQPPEIASGQEEQAVVQPEESLEGEPAAPEEVLLDELAVPNTPDWLEPDADLLEPTSDEALEAAETEAAVEAEAAWDPASAVSELEEQADDESSPPARRKRRRRGRRKPAPETEPTAPSAEGDELEEDEQSAAAVEEYGTPGDAGRTDRDDERVKRKRRRRKRSPAQEEGELAAGAAPPRQGARQEQSGADEGQEKPSPGDRSKHHQIPTWEEAIGIVIGANMESRTKSPSGGSRGGARGRGRGRRRG